MTKKKVTWISPIVIVSSIILIWSNIFGQNCLQEKLENVEYINNSNAKLPEQFIEEDKILLDRLFEEQKLCKELDNISYIYVSHFQTSGYSYKTSSASHSIFLFTENMKLLYWYSGHTKDLTKRLQIPLLIRRNEDIEESDMNYKQTILKQVAENDVSNIEKEQNEITSGCNCVNYEIVYHITPDKTKVYFFDLFYKKLFNGDFDENFQEELDQYIKELSE